MEMKSTAERLAQSYCFPDESNFERFRRETNRYPFLTTASDELLYEHGPRRYYYYGGGPREGSKEVSVDVFCDLYNDRIAPWRLIEDGWTPFEHATAGTAYEYRCNEDALLTFVPLGDGLPEFHSWPTDIDGETGNLSVPYYGIKTYTDLLNLIRLIG